MLFRSETHPPEGHSPPAQDSEQPIVRSPSPDGGPSIPTRFKQALVAEKALRRATSTDQMVDRIMSRLDKLDAYWQSDDTILEKLDRSSLIQLIKGETELVDRLQALQGKATQIIGVEHQQKMDKVLPVLMEAMKQRGLEVTATERTLEITTK